MILSLVLKVSVAYSCFPFSFFRRILFPELDCSQSVMALLPTYKVGRFLPYFRQKQCFSLTSYWWQSGFLLGSKLTQTHYVQVAERKIKPAFKKKEVDQGMFVISKLLAFSTVLIQMAKQRSVSVKSGLSFLLDALFVFYK